MVSRSRIGLPIHCIIPSVAILHAYRPGRECPWCWELHGEGTTPRDAERVQFGKLVKLLPVLGVGIVQFAKPIQLKLVRGVKSVAEPIVQRIERIGKHVLFVKLLVLVQRIAIIVQFVAKQFMLKRVGILKFVCRFFAVSVGVIEFFERVLLVQFQRKPSVRIVGGIGQQQLQRVVEFFEFLVIAVFKLVIERVEFVLLFDR